MECEKTHEMQEASVIIAEFVPVDGIGDNSEELLAERIRHELFEIHDGAIVFSRKTVTFFSDLWPSEVAAVSAWHLLARAIVLPYTIFEEGL